jgi:hypothetical protein
VRCARPGPHAKIESATERIKINHGSAVALSASGVPEIYPLDFLSPPLCRMHAVELILALGCLGFDSTSAPLTYEFEQERFRALLERNGL